ncbi:MAG: hypothetical protein R2827_09425 [Bdellovibrionales bacterium]
MNDLDPELVGLLLFKFLDQKNDISVLAKEYNDELRLHYTHLTRFGLYLVAAQPEIEEFDIENKMMQWMNWLSNFSREETEQRAGSLAIEFYNLLISIYGRQKINEIKSQINVVMAKYVTLLNDLQANVGSTDYSKLYFDKKKVKHHLQFISAFCAELEWNVEIEDIERNALPEFQAVRVLQNTTNSLRQKLEFGLKILRNLQTSILEATYEVDN